MAQNPQNLYRMTEESFSYDAFDQLVEALLTQGQLLVSAYSFSTTAELDLDLQSLLLKTAKVCALADIDARLQRENFCNVRTRINQVYHKEINRFVLGMLTPFINQVVEGFQAEGRFEGVQAEQYQWSVAEVLHCLKAIPEVNLNGIDDTIAAACLVEQEMQKMVKTKQSPMTHMERMWLLFEIYALMCYLMAHFIRMDELTNEEIDTDEARQIIMSHLKRYADSPEGRQELERYLESLRFDHDGRLTVPLLRAAQKELRKEVPERLQLIFMRHIDELDALVNELMQLDELDVQEFVELVAAVCKWQLLAREIEAINHPQLSNEQLPNQVFCTMLHDKPIDLRQLRERIKRMLPYVKRKNHWFCVWSVLRFRNLLATEQFEAFAQQMMLPEWFGNEPSIVTFSGDTLNEYSGYFTDSLYPRWNEKEYQLYLATHRKHKWGPTLCQRFTRLCLEMDEAFRSEGEA